DLDGDGVADLVVGAWSRDTETLPMAGAVAIFYGPIQETRHWSEADAWLLGEDMADAAGWSVAFAGDTNGDGLDDLLIGAIGHDGGGPEAGAAYLVHGPVFGEVLLEDADAVLTGESAFANAGTAVASAGDVDGDGLDDLLIGAPGQDRAYVVLSPVEGLMDLALSDAIIDGDGTSARTGFSLAGVGDLDGDGLGDVLVGAPGGTAGSAVLFSGPTHGEFSLEDGALTLRGGSGAQTGFSVAGAGDTDGDGVPDLLLGALRDDLGGRNAGAAYLVAGSQASERPLTQTLYADVDGDG
ncbi:MAG: hypothetical protein GY913_04940, partial [Proteobacteria bacterium]|nr:hypothetical protein [Pseudomonadota bacterium]